MIPHVFDERASVNQPADIVADSPECFWHRTAGTLVQKAITISGTGAEVVTNVFAFTGNIELLGIWGTITDATETTTMTAAHLNVWDGTNQADLSDDAGVDLSGGGLGGLVIKSAVSTSALTFLDSDQVSINETAADRRQFVGAALSGKAATTNYIRFNVTTDANTNCEITWFVAWRCLCAGSTLTAV